MQGEDENIRDISLYWKPDIAEDAVLQLLLNMNSSMTSLLRGQLKTVEELVRLGQQLEDKLNQTQYDL